MAVRILVILFVLLKIGSSTVVVPQTDIILLLDSTDDGRSKNFEVEVRAAVQFVRAVYSRENRIGLYTFGDNTHDQFQLNSYNDEQQIIQAIKYMWFSTGNGAVERAINFTLSNGFQTSKGDRECVPNVFVILTHSAIKDESEALGLRDVLQQKYVRTFVLNMAGESLASHFTTMTGSSSRVLRIHDFTALESSIPGLVQQISSDIPNTGCGTLTQWQEWTKCSMTCGPGHKYRFRECKKAHETDKGCNADLSENNVCSEEPCTDPVDGFWADWSSWSGCTKTCDTGIQMRVRQCSEPRPQHGGKTCPGVKEQTQNCSEWSCPMKDCGKKCPIGGRISHDCETCECSLATLFGKITDETGLPLKNAEIYLQSRRYKPAAQSDEMGTFSVTGLCMMNEQIFVHAHLHESKIQDPLSVNSTHWTINGTLEKYIPAVFTVQPQDKVRMVGQSLSLCCYAVGKPSPVIYSWFKDDIELENQGTNGTLSIGSAMKSHTGTFKCSTETLAGVSQSDEALIMITDLSQDTCGAPIAKLEQLPAGCYQTGDTARKGSVDVGTCGQEKCMSSTLKDNGTCTDWWPHYCCDSKDVEIIDIMCDGFSYQMSKIQTCQCQLCIFRTTISGRAVGRNNSKDVPFQLGDIVVNGEKVASTNMAGFFKFAVPIATKRVVATFHDTVFKRFMDITKIIDVSDGEDVFATIVIPLRPNPIPFNTSLPSEISLGGGKDGISEVASLLIDEDSFVDADGQLYRGSAEASIHFMDPRDRDSLDAANGEFVTESAAGDKMALRTFGMFQLGVRDDKGSPLNVNKPINFFLDSSLFNISLDSNGDPDLALWDYDVNKGIWVENTKLQFSTNQVGRRKLLEASSTLFGAFKPELFPPLDVNEDKVKRVWTGRYTNCDKNTKQYITKKVKDPDTFKEGVVVIGVSVYTDMTLTEHHSTVDQSVTIHAYTQENTGVKAYVGKKEKRQLKNGHACLESFLNHFVYLYVESEGERLIPAKHSLPVSYPDIWVENSTVLFESVYMGPSNVGPQQCKVPPCTGPVYLHQDRAACDRAVNDDSYHFNFAFFTKPPRPSYAVGSKNVYDKKLSWYPVSPDKATYRACYIKLLLKVYETFDIRILATSRLGNFSGDQFGTLNVGPIPDFRANNFNRRGACMEFRCPGYIKDGSTEIFDQPTAVQIQLLSTNSSMKCTLRVRNPNLQPDITPISNGTRGDIGLKFLSQPGRNYGSSYGIFINDAHQKDVERFCRNGQDSGSQFDSFMQPDKNYAVEFDCLN